MLLPFLRRTLCLSILSLCLPKDVHFQHDFQLQKTQFLQLFPPFPPCLSARTVFPFRGHPSHTTSPSKSPAFLPFIFPFRGHPSQPHSPQQFPSLLPCFFPFRTSDRQNLYQKPVGSVQNRSLSVGNHHLHRAGGRGFSGGF